MKNSCSFLIVGLVFLAACSAPRQVVLEKEVIVLLHDTIHVTTPVPATTDTDTVAFDWVDGQEWLDSFLVEDSFSFAQVVAKLDTVAKKRTYKVTHGRKADTIYRDVPIVITDTIFVQVECPPTLPALPANGKFPWWWVLAALGALSIWWVGKSKKGKSVS